MSHLVFTVMVGRSRRVTGLLRVVTAFVTGWDIGNILTINMCDGVTSPGPGGGGAGLSVEPQLDIQWEEKAIPGNTAYSHLLPDIPAYSRLFPDLWEKWKEGAANAGLQPFRISAL